MCMAKRDKLQKREIMAYMYVWINTYECTYVYIGMCERRREPIHVNMPNFRWSVIHLKNPYLFIT